MSVSIADRDLLLLLLKTLSLLFNFVVVCPWMDLITHSLWLLLLLFFICLYVTQFDFQGNEKEN